MGLPTRVGQGGHGPAHPSHARNGQHNRESKPQRPPTPVRDLTCGVVTRTPARQMAAASCSAGSRACWRRCSSASCCCVARCRAWALSCQQAGVCVCGGGGVGACSQRVLAAASWTAGQVGWGQQHRGGSACCRHMPVDACMPGSSSRWAPPAALAAAPWRPAPASAQLPPSGQPRQSPPAARRRAHPCVRGQQAACATAVWRLAAGAGDARTAALRLHGTCTCGSPMWEGQLPVGGSGPAAAGPGHARSRGARCLAAHL